MGELTRALDQLRKAIEQSDPGWRERALEPELSEGQIRSALPPDVALTPDLAEWFGWANGSRRGLRTTDGSVVFIVDFLPVSEAAASFVRLGTMGHADGGTWLPIAHSMTGADFAVCCSGPCLGEVAAMGPTHIAAPDRRAASLMQLVEWWTEPWREGHWYRTPEGQRGEWESPYAYTDLV